ncbi:MAG: hypothetical protein HY367_00270 [Candidatus Aenigmarchaeota archaeon]|nr:hypothetical protein [Candidatus Aenigmarchaeota archaeon]
MKKKKKDQSQLSSGPEFISPEDPEEKEDPFGLDDEWESSDKNFTKQIKMMLYAGKKVRNKERLTDDELNLAALDLSVGYNYSDKAGIHEMKAIYHLLRSPPQKPRYRSAKYGVKQDKGFAAGVRAKDRVVKLASALADKHHFKRVTEAPVESSGIDIFQYYGKDLPDYVVNAIKRVNSVDIDLTGHKIFGKIIRRMEGTGRTFPEALLSELKEYNTECYKWISDPGVRVRGATKIFFNKLLEEIKEYPSSKPNKGEADGIYLDYLDRLFVSLDSPESDIDFVRVETNECVWHDIYDLTGACVFAPGSSNEASILYCFDQNIILLSLNAYHRKGGFIGSIGKAINVITEDAERGSRVFLVDGVLGGPHVDTLDPSLGDWKRLMYSGILKLAKKAKIGRSVFNTQHSGGQFSVHDFNAYVAERVFENLTNKGHGEYWNMREGKFRLKRGPYDTPSGFLKTEQKGISFEYTHNLVKPPLDGFYVRNFGKKGYKGGHFLDSWYEWNRFLGSRHPEWNNGKGFVKGIEVDVKQELDRLEKQLYSSE